MNKKLCINCQSRLQQDVDLSQGKTVKLGASPCLNPEHKNGRVYGCYYYFIKELYEAQKKAYESDSTKKEIE